MPDTETRLWIKYGKERTYENRNRLVEMFWPNAESLANRVISNEVTFAAYEGLDAEDLIQEAGLGLISAVEAYDPSNGSNFWGFARRRVRGQILDHLRQMGWVTRKGIRKARAESKALQLEERPTYFKSYARPMYISALERWQNNTRTIVHFTQEGDFLLADKRVRNDPTFGPTERDTCRQLFQTLQPLEQVLFADYALGGYVLKQIGYAVKLSESRLSQLLSGIRKRMVTNPSMQHIAERNRLTNRQALAMRAAASGPGIAPDWLRYQRKYRYVQVSLD